MISRLLMLGAPLDVLRDRGKFRYVEPEDEQHLRKIILAAIDWRPEVAVVDSIGELLPILRLSSNSPDDFTIAHALVLKPLAAAGACVIAVDHLAKGTDSRAAGPTGTAAKRRAVGGVSMRVTLKDPFVPGRGGRAALTVHKDRHGGLRKYCPPPQGGEASAGTFVLEQHDDQTIWHVAAPKESDQAPSQALADDIAALGNLDPAPTSVRDVKDRMKWGSTRASDTFRAWCSPFPAHRGRNGEHACQACAEPLNQALAEADETAHPTCEPAL
jgi:hypothetical protein